MAALFLMSGCEKLDREVITNITEKQVTESYQYTGYRQAALYTELPEGFLQVDRAMMASATDEAEYTLENGNVQKFNNGAWNAYDNPDNAWGKYFKAVRKVNQFLAASDSINLDTYRLSDDPSDQQIYQTRSAEIVRWKLEARFLRAFFYFELVKRYGGVPIFTSELAVQDDFANVERNSLQDCIDFIVKECDEAAGGLPTKYGDSDLGRATKGAALALKSRALLYAAILIVRVLVVGRDVPGYASLMVALLFAFAIQMMAFGVLGEYVGRLYEEVKGRPIYIVQKRIGFGA